MVSWQDTQSSYNPVHERFKTTSRRDMQIKLCDELSYHDLRKYFTIKPDADTSASPLNLHGYGLA